MSDRADSRAPVSVSPATERDVAEVHGLLAPWEREGITIGHYAGDEAYLRGLLAESFFVARDSRRIVGFVCARIVDNPGRARQLSIPREMPRQILERRVETGDFDGEVRQWVRSILTPLEERTRVPKDLSAFCVR